MAIVASLLLALIVAVLTLSPATPGPEGIPHIDKLAHLLAFAAVAAPLAWRFPRHWRAMALCGLAYGGVIEIVQPFTGRSAEWGDFLADGIGAFAGAGLAFAGRLRWPAALAGRGPVDNDTRRPGRVGSLSFTVTRPASTVPSTVHGAASSGDGPPLPPALLARCAARRG
jgi:VanZ family protein